MENWEFGQCPKCGGDLFQETVRKSRYKVCLQCSFRQKLGNTGRRSIRQQMTDLHTYIDSQGETDVEY